MDRDIVARTTRLGRQARDALDDMIVGRPADLSALARLLDHLFRAAGGVPTAESILSVLDSPPLLRRAYEALCDQIERIPTAGTLDLQLKSAAQRAVLNGGSASDALVDFFERAVSAHAVDARGGLLEQRGADVVDAHRRAIRQTIRPVAQRAAELLRDNPRRQTLGLMREYRLTETDDLLPRH